MATIRIGSARHDEYGKYSGGAKGDSLQKSSKDDTIGEVSIQIMYNHPKGWHILRPIKIDHANGMATLMKKACNNKNVGYDQGNRLAIITDGINSKKPTECDCSTLVREAIKESTGKDPGNFTTYNEAAKLEATGLFEKRQAYISQSKTPLYNGDVLVTKTKGHTAIVVSGNPRKPVEKVPEKSEKEAPTIGKAKSLDKKLEGTYIVTAYSLNVRAGAGKNKPILVTVPKGARVICHGYYTTVSDTKWLLVNLKYKNKAYTGFCSMEYLEEQ